jgi:NADH dehydrogenase FAD-containing subunit
MINKFQMIRSSHRSTDSDSLAMNSIEADTTADGNILRKQFQERSINASAPQISTEKGQSIIIVGAGAFGSSLALELMTHYRERYLH